MNARSSAVVLATTLALGIFARRASQASAVTGTEAPASARWQVALLAGTGSLGPAKDLERAMVSAGFNDPGWSWWGPPVKYPFSSAGRGLLVSVRVPHGRNEWTAHLGSNRTGVTRGFRQPNYYVEIRHEVRMLALTLGRPASGHWSVGAGPALYVLSGAQETEGTNKVRTNAPRVGLLFDAGLRWPARSRWYCDFALQYRLMGRARVGPFPAGISSADDVALPATSPRFDHLFVAVGVGRRQ